MLPVILAALVGVPNGGTGNANGETINGPLMHGCMFDDVQVVLASAKVPGMAAPDWGTFPDGAQTSAYLFSPTTTCFHRLLPVFTDYYLFSPTSDECVEFSAQIPHRYQEGTAILPHIHWAPTSTNTGTVAWVLYYARGNPGDVFVDSSYVTAQGTADGTDNKHMISSFAGYSNTPARKISSILLGKICRDADGTYNTDTYADDVAGVAVDFHVCVDAPGSRQELVK